MSVSTGLPVFVLGHPGHELRVHGLLEQHHPLVLVLTDGSGRYGRSRLDRTSAILEKAGARPGPVYGAMTDHEIYEDLLAGRHERLIGIARTLASLLTREGSAWVAGDAAEGYNPTHDVCRLVINAAVAIAARRGLSIPNLEFPLDAPPDDGCAGEEGVSLRLDEEGLRRKAGAAAEYVELEADVLRMLDRFGLEAFRTETLRPVRYGFDLRGKVGAPPFYEVHGARRVEEGAYGAVLRFSDHVEPAAHALEEAALTDPVP